MSDSKNYEVLHHFIEGMRGDFDQHAETNNSYQNGVNGRLYSHNGVVSYSSIKGTKQVYVNTGIVKYLGYWAFEDELIIFVKCLPNTTSSGGTGTVEYETITQLVARSFGANSNTNTVVIDIDSHVSENTYQIPVYTADANPLEFTIPLSCVPNSENEIDFTEYYDEILNQNNFESCSLINNGSLENNREYIDCVFSLKKDSAGNIYDELKWSGLLNWPMDGKICTHGIYENNFYKRIYFTDYTNPFRVINLKDPNLSTRNANELETFQSAVLLQPKVISINNDGQLKAGTILYAYRLYTENGQITEFSPFSNSVKILVEDTGYEYAGGDISETTDKSVTVKCNVVGWENFNEIECIAVEYEAFGAPTSIRSLGIKSVAPVVIFDHYGNEAEFSSDLTLSEILVRQNTWKYCSDLSSKSNKLIAIGLRNDPIPTELSSLNKFFTLHGWDENGETHNCLINPKPWKYRYIDPSNTSKMFYIKQKLYNSIQVFGNFTINLVNQVTGNMISQSFVSSTGQLYEECLNDIYTWLNSLQLTPLFQATFPNLKVEFTQNKLLFTPLVPATQTDFDDYKFTYNTQQVIEDIEEDLQFINLSVSGTLVYGAVSLGFNQGNGIRVSYQTETEEVLEKATAGYPGSQPILNVIAPNGKKCFFKGELYRLGLQLFDKNGYQLFVLPLGDIQIPLIGEVKKYIDDSGVAVIESTTYSNSKVVGNKLVAEKITLKVEVRLSCEVQKLVSMYQLVYVERDEDNRTILCQGISAPMERTNIFHHAEYIQLPENIANKWCLPYYGGPTYDKRGLETFDANPNEENQWNWETRVVTHRSLMYLDSPDIVFNRINADKVKNGSVNRIGRLNTDHSRNSIRQTSGERYPAFSRKIYYNEIAGEEKRRSDFVNVSVFLERAGINDLIPIDKSELLEIGQIMPGGKFGVNQEVSNNGLTLQKQPWFYSAYGRNSAGCSLDDGAKSELFNSSNYSPGFPTVVLKASENVFTNAFINQIPFTVNPEVRDPYNGNLKCYDTHGLINIKMGNEQSVYGGRSELSYSKNVFIPLGDTIPVLTTSNNTQVFKVYGDTYCSLYIRNKNNYNTGDVRDGYKINNSGGCENKHEEHGTNRNGAWCYAVVLESSIETKWTDKDTFYKLGHSFDFQRVWQEYINEAYYQENTLRTYLPKPFKFKDDPNMGHIIAVSETKMMGDFIDKWTQFKVNNFYELEKDKGVGYNLAKSLGNIFAIQERQTSLLQIDENVMIPSSNGEISMQQGNGEGVTNHQIQSDYGTSIRRAVVEVISNSQNIGGFTFFDEKRFEWVKSNVPILIERDLHLKMRELFEDNKIIDTEGYFDDEYKETNIRIRTKNGASYMLSFNEKIGVFNGWIEYDNDIYMVWNENIYAPISKEVINPLTGLLRPDSSIVHQLNKGIFLNFFEEEHKLKILVTCNKNPEMVKIFKHWAGIINTDYHIENMVVRTSSGQVRLLNGLHYRYQIKEGRHSLPLKNRNDWDDLRGEWATLEIEIKSKNNKKVDLFSFINFVRHSYQ